ncbi:MAG TPA: SET domain-containing protein-lysine N-methyltransferase [Chloroflexota bacterium]|jgi:hypothetical protein|nr:SET domain-containing protein-lysine N-methyltransferase [Chloroflexota bacterium]
MTDGSSWLDPRIEVRPSRIHGLGLFATGPIQPAEVLIRWLGTELPIEDLARLKHRIAYACAALSERTIMLFDTTDPVVNGNHSCDPNMWMHDATTESARRTIEVGEELTIDYAMHSDDAHWQMPCDCRTSLCRKIIRGDDWKLPELQERYQNHFSPYLTRRFELRSG